MYYYYISLLESIIFFNKGGVFVALLSAWTPEDKIRLRGLVLHHLGTGGTVMDACQQFQFETSGRHKANSARLRWLLQLRWTHAGKGNQVQTKEPSGETYTPPVEDKVSVVNQTYAPQEESFMDTQRIYGEDEASVRLLNAVTHILEDRRQLKDDVQESRKLADLSQRKVKESEEDRKALELKLVEKDNEIEKQERLLVDTQYKLHQVQEDYNQLSEARNSEYNRLQDQISELQSKYETLGQDYANLRRENTLQIEKLEAALRGAEAKNAQLVAEAEGVRKENVALTRRITDFAQQIASALGQVPTDPPAVTPVPIRAAVTKMTDNEKSSRAQA